VIPNPQPNSAPIEILGKIKYSTPAKPLKAIVIDVPY